MHMPELKNRPPKYRLHQASGHAIVTLRGRDHYLGKYGSPESEARYKQLVAEWAEPSPAVEVPQAADGRAPDLRICELLTAYLVFAEQYYRKDGRLTGEYANVKDAMRPVENLYSKAPWLSSGHEI